MEEAYSSDSEASVGSDTRSSSLSLHYSASSFEDVSLRESDEPDHESGGVEPYQYEPEESEEESSVADSGSTEEGDDPRRERLDNTDW